MWITWPSSRYGTISLKNGSCARAGAATTFYYIIREENLFPSDAEYSYRYINMLEEYVEIYKDSYSEELDKCETEEEEKKVIEGIKEDILSYYGQSYFEDAINYEYMIEKLSESVTVVD